MASVIQMKSLDVPMPARVTTMPAQQWTMVLASASQKVFVTVKGTYLMSVEYVEEQSSGKIDRIFFELLSNNLDIMNL